MYFGFAQKTKNAPARKPERLKRGSDFVPNQKRTPTAMRYVRGVWNASLLRPVPNAGPFCQFAPRARHWAGVSLCGHSIGLSVNGLNGERPELAFGFVRAVLIVVSNWPLTRLFTFELFVMLMTCPCAKRLR